MFPGRWFCTRSSFVGSELECVVSCCCVQIVLDRTTTDNILSANFHLVSSTETSKQLLRHTTELLTFHHHSIQVNHSMNETMSSPSPPVSSKSNKTPADDGKVYYSYGDIHDSVSRLVPTLQTEFAPTVLIAIGGGGFIPARILRTELKVPILAISLELYDDTTNTIRPKGVVCHQWFDVNSEPGKLVEGGNVLIVDEVDDTRTTLQYAVEEVWKRCKPAKVAVCVVHNKNKPKKGTLPDTVPYFAAEEVEDHWLCYPWDAAEYGRSIQQHEALAMSCSGKAQK